MLAGRIDRPLYPSRSPPAGCEKKAIPHGWLGRRGAGQEAGMDFDPVRVCLILCADSLLSENNLHLFRAECAIKRAANSPAAVRL